MTAIPINVRQKPWYEGPKALDGNTYRFTISWNLETEKWYMDLKGLNNTVEVNGIALLPGKNLLAPYGFYQLGELWVIDNSGANEDPDYDQFGSRWTLEYTPLADL